MDAAGKLLPFVPWSKNPRDSPVRRAIAGAFSWLERHPKLSHYFERFEYLLEERGLRLPELR